MEDAKRIAVENSRQVLEEGEVLEGMATDGPSLTSSRLTTEQANALRAQSSRQWVQEPEQ
jgi:hypothetical protein